MIPAYVQALCREIEYVGARVPESDGAAHTIFFGGGTPSLLSPDQFGAIFESLRASFRIMEDAEITMEANPGTVSFENLSELRKHGMSRISFGVQSASATELRMLERTHGFLDVIHAVSSARRAGFDNLNLDLIYGLPEQSLETWQSTVRRILNLHPEHISAYALTLEHGTPFGKWAARGLLPLPDPDMAAEMYEWASEQLAAAGYIQYEISNWARPGRECRHNLQYWRSLPYLAFGAGAHGYANGYRYSNVLRIRTYIDRLEPDHPSHYPFPLSPAVVNQNRQLPADDMSEFMITGLRLTREGVSEHAFQERFGISLQEAYGTEVRRLLELGLLEKWNHNGGRNGAVTAGNNTIPAEGVRLTPRGRLLGNQVFLRFVGEGR